LYRRGSITAASSSSEQSSNALVINHPNLSINNAMNNCKILFSSLDFLRPHKLGIYINFHWSCDGTVHSNDEVTTSSRYPVDLLKTVWHIQELTADFIAWNFSSIHRLVQVTHGPQSQHSLYAAHSLMIFEILMWTPFESRSRLLRHSATM
jgi:hypothetical protein